MSWIVQAEAVTVEQLRAIATFEDARGAKLRAKEPEQLKLFEVT